MDEREADSVRYYDRNAARFAADTGTLDMSTLHDRFLRYVPPGGRILDAGCGVGRDALAFVERGYRVVAFDGSVEMVRLARERLGDRADVFHRDFREVTWQSEFDGVWACASLLHVSAEEFPGVVGRLCAAQRPGGALYMSFKYGDGERQAGERRFIDHTEDSLRRALDGAQIEFLDLWQSADARPGRASERWLNAIVTPITTVPTRGQR